MVDNVIYNFNLYGIDYYYNPIFSFDLKYYSPTLTVATTSTTFSYPSYSFTFNNGDLVFKDLLDTGVFESGVGLNYPFLNNYNYLYNDFKFYIRRNVPIANYSGDTSNDSILYDQTLINNNIGRQRLC